MPKDGNQTRIRILDETISLVLENGFAGTTIDHILDKAKITKGAFFYHFKSKADLGHQLMDHFAAKDIKELEDALSETAMVTHPKERLIRFVQRFIDIMKTLESPYPGCLYASYVYEPEQFSQEIKDIVSQSILRWREALIKLMKAASQGCSIPKDFDYESLADQFTVILEGAYIVSKALNDPGLTSRQLVHFKHYLQLLYVEKRKKVAS